LNFNWVPHILLKYSSPLIQEQRIKELHIFDYGHHVWRPVAWSSLSFDRKLFMFYHFSVASYFHVENPYI